MARLREEDGDEDRDDLEYQTYLDKMKNEKEENKEKFGPGIQDWEANIWDDVKYDDAGNVLKKLDNEWEIQSSPSVRERRRLQQQSEWPLSARIMKEKDQSALDRKHRAVDKQRFGDQHTDRNHSHQWSFDQEGAGSEGLEWNALPD